MVEPKQESVVILLDANDTMLEEYEAEEDEYRTFWGTTKLDIANYVTQQVICASSEPHANLQIVAVIVLRTDETNHHFHRAKNGDALFGSMGKAHSTGLSQNDEIVFPNMVELSGNDIDLQEKIQRFSIRKRSRKWKRSAQESNCQRYESKASEMKGDFLNGIILATDTLYRYIHSQGTSIPNSLQGYISTGLRRILLLTDGKHKSDFNPQQVLVAIDCFKAMNFQLDVVLFGGATLHDTDSCAPPAVSVDTAAMGRDDDDEDDECSSFEVESDEEYLDEIQHQNEIFLRDLITKIRGSLLVPNGMDDILDNTLNRNSHRRTDIHNDTVSTVSAQGPDIGSMDDYNLQTTCGNANQAIRNESSLYLSLGRRIHWDGSDDVSLQEWLQTIKPSVVDSGSCSWIQIENVNQNSPGYADMSDTTYSNGQRDLSSYSIPLKEISEIIASGARVPKAAKLRCVDEIMRMAKEDLDTVGKWLLFVSPDRADEVWERVARATAMGHLGCSSKISPLANKEESIAVICVYVNDSTDKKEVQRVLKTLHYGLGIENGLSNFKPDIFTYLNIYANNPWRLNPTLYQWEEALTWDITDEDQGRKEP